MCLFFEHTKFGESKILEHAASCWPFNASCYESLAYMMQCINSKAESNKKFACSHMMTNGRRSIILVFFDHILTTIRLRQCQRSFLSCMSPHCFSVCVCVCVLSLSGFLLDLHGYTAAPSTLMVAYHTYHTYHTFFNETKSQCRQPKAEASL